MKLYSLRIALLCGLLAIAGLLPAQTHYPAGVEGVKGSSLPPPGVYFRDYNYIYFSDYYKEGPPSFDLFANVQAPRLIWITRYKLLGGYYGADIIVPFAYTDLDMSTIGKSRLGVADIFVEPITLSWHLNQFDFAFGYGFWAPTGDFSVTDAVSPGKGFWTHMLTGGVTIYPDKGKTWSISALNRYEFNQENKDARVTPGQFWTLEWGLAKTVRKNIDLGLAGYIQAQTTSNDLGGSATPRGEKERVAAVGPEITFPIPKLGFTASIRYMREMGAKLRPEGNTINVIFTKRLGP